MRNVFLGMVNKMAKKKKQNQTLEIIAYAVGILAILFTVTMIILLVTGVIK